MPDSRGRTRARDLGLAFILAVLMPLALATGWRMLRRGKAAAPAARESREDAERMVRLEQAVDTIAVEVERISKGQRFVTQLLAEAREPRQLHDARTLDPVARVPR